MPGRSGTVSVLRVETSQGVDTEFDRVMSQLLMRWPESRIDPSLERISALLDLLGQPQLAMPIIQVTGTNGKSSTARMIASLLGAMGLRTGLYTSPHLNSATERIEIDGQSVSEAEFVRIWNDIAPFVAMLDEPRTDESSAPARTPLSFFEVLTAMAYSAFADAPVDVAVVEVGMGGRWDATSVAPAQVAVVLPIDLDHTDYLGDTTVDIAREKAAIIAPQGAAVIASQSPEVATVINARIADVSAVGYWEESAFEVVERDIAVGGQLLTIRGTAATYADVFLPVFGEHQAHNFACAISAVEVFLGGRSLDGAVVEEGVAEVTTTGRLEIVRRGPTVVVDAAHNPAGARALAAAITESFAFSYVVGVIAVLADKDVRGILIPLADVFDEVVVTRNHSPRCLDVDDLAAAAVEIFGADCVEIADSFADAIDTAVRLAEEADTYAASGIVVTGSVVTAGQARALMVRS